MFAAIDQLNCCSAEQIYTHRYVASQAAEQPQTGFCPVPTPISVCAGLCVQADGVRCGRNYNSVKTRSLHRTMFLWRLHTCSGSNPETVLCTRGSLDDSLYRGSVPTTAGSYRTSSFWMTSTACRSLAEASAEPAVSTAHVSASNSSRVDNMPLSRSPVRPPARINRVSTLIYTYD